MKLITIDKILKQLLLMIVVINPAVAATIFKDDFSPQQPGWSFASPSVGFLGELNNRVNVSSVTLSLNSILPDSDAILAFDLLPFRSLDPVNCCTDTFSLSINGSTVFSGAFSGGAGSTVFQNTNGATVKLNPNNFYEIVVPHMFLSGANTYTFSYTPLQQFFDEAWGLDNVIVSTVPTPTAALLFAPALIGFSALRRKKHS